MCAGCCFIVLIYIIRALQVYDEYKLPMSQILRAQHLQGNNPNLSGPLRYPRCCVFWIQTDQSGTVLPDCRISVLGVSIGFRRSSQVQYCQIAEFLFWVLLLASDGAVRYSIARLQNFCFGCCYWLQTEQSGTVLPDC